MSNLSKHGYDLLINYVETLKHRYYPFINYVNHVKLFNIFTTKKINLKNKKYVHTIIKNRS